MAKKDNEEIPFSASPSAGNSEKLKALQAAMDKIEKTFGKGSIMKMGDDNVQEVEVIPTGSIALNAALGVGGYPKGRIIEIYGPESSGKTTLAIHAIAEAQKAGGIAAFIDAEHAFDRFYAAKLGVDVDNLWISQPDNGEQALEIAEQLIRSSAIDIIVIDSVAALTPKAEIEGDMGDNKVGLQARLMSQALRKLTSAISKTNTTCIFINQLREKIGIMFGNPETTTGGNALKFYASVRLDIRRSTQLKDGEEVIGNQTKVKVVKNKVAPPFRKAEFDIMFGEGISRAGEIIDLGADLGIIKKSGSWYSYNETKLGQGRDASKQVIQDNPELAEELEGLIFAALKEQEKFEIDVFQLVKVLWKRKFLIALVALVAGLAAFAYSSFVIKPQYASTTRIYVVNRNQADKPGLTNQDLQAGSYLVKDYREIILSQDVLEKVVADQNLTIDAKTLGKKVSVTVPADTRIVSISVRDGKPEEASRIANALREVAAQKIISVTRVSDVTTLEEARPATSPSSPNIRRNTMMATIAGVGIVIVIVLLVELLDDRVKRPEDIEEVMHISLLGVIPNLEKLK